MRNPYPKKYRRTEPDIRQELINTLDGAFPETSKKQTALLRKMSSTKCPCVDDFTREADKDFYCPICLSEGYIWSESYIDVYKVVIKSDVGNALKETLQAPGLINEPATVFYTKYSVDISDNDKIVELVLDSEGEIVRPTQRRAIYRIGTLLDMRNDNGRIEYWKITTYKEYSKFLNGPEG